MARWRPKGKGFIRVSDTGDRVVWMRPEKEGGVTIAYYAPEVWELRLPMPEEFQKGKERPLWYSDKPGRAQVWIVKVPSDSDLPWEMTNKPWRISGATLEWNTELYDWQEPGDIPFNDQWCYSIDIFEVPANHKGHRRLKYTRPFYKGWKLPRKLREALDV